jgi:hypothetical protein
MGKSAAVKAPLIGVCASCRQVSELGGFLSSLEEKSLQEILDIINRLKSRPRPDVYLISKATEVLSRKARAGAEKAYCRAAFTEY